MRFRRVTFRRFDTFRRLVKQWFRFCLGFFVDCYETHTTAGGNVSNDIVISCFYVKSRGTNEKRKKENKKKKTDGNTQSESATTNIASVMR